MRSARPILPTALGALALLTAGPALAAKADVPVVQAKIDKWVADFNRGDLKAFTDACAPQAAVVDGFPPYAWPTCAAWISDFETNNKAIAATDSKLAIGKPIYSEVIGDSAYFVYPATFTDKQADMGVTYTGTWTITARRTPGGWVFTGSASAWGVNSLPPTN